MSSEPAKRSLDLFRCQTSTLSSRQGCLHEVVYPANEPLKPLTPIVKMAKTYPFTLDHFQRQAILCIDNGQSVIVSAHTSAGKTAVAEYAVARSLRERQRVIYTTPIKALSNQKFREFNAEFKDVGLMTGDNTTKPESAVLIMTTEVLRSMLYRGLDFTREVGWVVFDEIHYLRDKERGVVWEETIILLPHTVGLVFLSATIPNARQFAEWIVCLRNRPCHVVYTDCRPVPLQQYVFPCGGDKIHFVVNQQREFLESNFQAALAILQKAAGETRRVSSILGRKIGTMRTQSDCAKLVNLVMERNLGPVIVFLFSIKDCEFLGTQLNKMNYNTDTEKAEVDQIFNNAVDVLSAEDKRLPQVQTLLSVLRRGIGIHHGDLIPILKEIVEILFTKGLIKVLYATETFAMGLNMPARTVLFGGTQKFDIRKYRLVTSAEYIQMSGRAGRRGKDDLGTVILMLNNEISAAEARLLLLGEPDRLDSAFYLTNSMILSLQNVKGITPELMLEKSFYHFQNRSTEQYVRELEFKLQTLRFPTDVDMKQLESYVKLKEALASANRGGRALTTESESVIPFSQPNRVVQAVHALESQVSLSPLACRPDIDQLVDIYTQRPLIEVELRRTKDVLDKKNAIFHELKERKRFLRQLGFCSETDELTFKGRVACEISSGDELILTELLLDNFFSPLTPVQLAGVMSCFVAKKPVGKHQHTQLRSDMAQALETIKAKARSLARVAIECGICYSRGSSDPINEKSDDIAKLAAQLNNWMRLVADEQACVDQFSGHLMEVVRAWAEGVCFARLREFAPLSDGIIIRCLRKLSGLLRQMHNAAKVAGRTELGNKFLEALVLIQRDIVFAASLYLPKDPE